MIRSSSSQSRHQCHSARIDNTPSQPQVGALTFVSTIPILGGKGLLQGSQIQQTIIPGTLVAQTRIIDAKNVMVLVNTSDRDLTLLINGTFTYTSNGQGFVVRINLHGLHNQVVLSTTSQLAVGASTSINGGSNGMNDVITVERCGALAFGFETVSCTEVCSCGPLTASDLCISVHGKMSLMVWPNNGTD